MQSSLPVAVPVCLDQVYKNIKFHFPTTEPIAVAGGGEIDKIVDVTGGKLGWRAKWD